MSDPVTLSITPGQTISIELPFPYNLLQAFKIDNQSLNQLGILNIPADSQTESLAPNTEMLYDELAGQVRHPIKVTAPTSPLLNFPNSLAPASSFTYTAYQTGDRVPKGTWPLYHGNVSNVGGNVVTNPGFPARVAFQPRLVVNSTAAQLVLTYTPPVTQHLRVSLYGWGANGTTPRIVSANVAYTDDLEQGGAPPGQAVTLPFAFDAFAGTSSNVGMVLDGSTNIPMPAALAYFSCSPVEIVARAGTTVAVQFQDNAGTPGYRLAAVIEQLN